MLTYKRVLTFLLLAAFAPELDAAIRFALNVLLGLGDAPALQGVGRSGLRLVADAALIWGAARLLGRLWRGRGTTPAYLPADAEAEEATHG